MMIHAAVIGWPIHHSLSPRLHGYWLKKYGIAGSYKALAVDPEELEDFFQDFERHKLKGVNVTLPHKEKVMEFMDYIDPLALRVGAVNTIVFTDDDKFEGRNTDVYGFGQNLIAGGYVVDHRPVLLIGAGGAARAALVALQDMGVTSFHLMNRTAAKAEGLAKDLALPSTTLFGWGDAQAFENVGLVVNATSLGLKNQSPLQLSLDFLPHNAFVTDTVYNPLLTDFLEQAQRRGNKIIDGLGMLLYQAQPAFAAFYGTTPEVTPDLRHYVAEGL